MFMEKLRWTIGFVGLLCVSVSSAISPIFTISPSTPSVTLRSDGSTSVIYTVTNNAIVPRSHLVITPGYETTGVASGLTIQNNFCGNVTLAHSESCQFGVIIQGANQPSNFFITPKVCALGSCSTTGLSNRLTVNVDQITLPPSAYFGIYQAVNSPAREYGLLSINANTGAIESINQNLHLHLSAINSPQGIAVSLDGSRVYVAEQANVDESKVADIAVFAVGSGGVLTLIDKISLPQITSTGVVFSLTLSPDDSTLYVSASPTVFRSKKLQVDQSVFDSNKVYSIDLTDGVVTDIPGFDALSGSRGIAVSPDGAQIFVANINDGVDQLGSIAVVDIATNTIVQIINNATQGTDIFNYPTQLTVSPDGSKLYVKNLDTILSGSVNGNNVVFGEPIIFGSSNDLFASYYSIALSSDGNTLYASKVNYIGSNAIMKINLLNNESTAINFSSPPSSGIALTPDNSTLFMAPLAGVGFETNVPNTLYPKMIVNLMSDPIVSTINLSILQATTQLGAFVN